MQRVLVGYAVWVVLLIAGYYGLPGLRTGAWVLIALSGAAAIVAGVAVNQPRRKAPWLLLAAALVSSAAGQVVFLSTVNAGTGRLFPSLADGIHLFTYPLCAAGLLGFIWLRTPDGDRRSLIDALILTAGAALLSWLFLILPYADNAALSLVQKSVSIAYPLGDVLLLTMIVRLLGPEAARLRCIQLLALGAVAGIASDTAYGLMQLHGTFRGGTVVDLGWAVLYAAWGAAALHPTMTRLTEPGARPGVEVSPVRLTVLLLASLVAPGVMLVQSVLVRDIDESAIAVFSAILFLLVVSRLRDVAASHRRALRRERAVRQAGAALVSAVTREAAAAAVSHVLSDLLGSLLHGDALLAVRTEGTFRAVTAGTTDPERARRLGEQAGGWLPLMPGPAPLLTPVATLPRRTRELVSGAGWALLCPLTLKDRPSGDPLVGVLALFGEKRVLADAYAAMEIVAQKVALTLERITLTAEVTRQGQEAYFRTLVQDTSDVILIIGADGKIRYATPSAATMFGDIAIEGAHLSDLAADADSGMTDLMLALPGAISPRYVDRRFTRRDGTRLQIQVRASDLRDDPTVAGLVLTIRDVTSQRQLEAQLKHQAFHDSLTGLPNRVLFQDRIGHEIAVVRRDGGIAAVMFVDLDDFKVVNDTLGHAVGDELLVAIAERLSGLIRASDTTARLGGDEFALLIAGAENMAAVETTAGRVVNAFADPFQLTSRQLLMSVTVGLATTMDSTDSDELLRYADLALYAAKAAGKRQWRRYQPVLSAGIIRRREVQAALEDAVARSAFTIVYQPIVDLATDEIAGFEALVRWPHEQWGMLKPDQFIAIAEETGQIVPLGAWVLQQALEVVTGWRRDLDRAGAPGRRPYVSVNVSARQFEVNGFVEEVRRMVVSMGLPPGALMLELTESVMLGPDERVHSELFKLKSMGVRLAIDDFGTGYSSLSYLRELPIDVLKIDKSFVDGIVSSPQSLALAESIIHMAQTLQLDVIAEGIETQSQRDLLDSLGCGFGQGYLMAMPLAVDEAEDLLRARTSLVHRGT